MKTQPHLLILLALLSVKLYAVPTPTDSILQRQVETIKRVDSLSASLQKLSRTNDSLNKELYYYRAKDDFYVSAVDRQGSHFEWLLATIIGGAGIFSYSYFRNRLDALRNDLQAKIDKYEEKSRATEESFGLVKFEVYKGVAVALNNICQATNPSGDFKLLDTHFNLYLASIYLLLKAKSEIKDKDDQRVDENLRTFIGNLSELIGKIEDFLKDNPQRAELKRTLKDQYASSTLINDLIKAGNETFSPDAFLLKQELIALFKEEDNQFRTMDPTTIS